MQNHTQTVRHLLSKVPEVTLFFWIIKVLCTTVGETAADFINVNLNIGLTGTSVIVGLLLVIVLALQFKAKTYIPSVYWTTVVIISVFGTLVTDNITDNFGVPLEFSTILFSGLLLGTFLWWHKSEGTLSIHSIYTKKRELFYWLAILWTFALGTAAGDLLAEGLGLGYVTTGLIVAGVVVTTMLCWRMGLEPVLAFWIIYILTRPLGASLGDFLTQPAKYGGLGFGAATTSALFGIAILMVIIFLSRTKTDVISEQELLADEVKKPAGGITQVMIVLGILLVVGVSGYFWSQRAADTVTPISLTAVPTATGTAAVKASLLGDLSSFKVIVDDMQTAVKNGSLTTVTERAGDLEFEWDAAEAKLKPLNKSAWMEVDDKIDVVLRQARSTRPDTTKITEALDQLEQVL